MGACGPLASVHPCWSGPKISRPCAAGRGVSLAAPGHPAALIGAPVAVPLPLQECSVGPPMGLGVRFPLSERAEDLQGAPQLAGVALWPLLAVLLR